MQHMLLLIIMPFVGAFFALFSPKGAREFLGLLVSLGTFILALSLFPSLSRAPLLFEYSFSPPVTFGLRIDYLALVIISLISLLGFFAALYSLDYMKEYTRLNKYYCLLLLFIGSMNGAVAAGDLLTLFLFWEFMTVSAFFLVMFDNRKESIRAAIKYFLMGEMGALCMLLSIAAVFCLKGTLDIVALSGVTFGPRTAHLLLLGFLIGAGVKAGMVPVHSWLPDAHPAAPSPVSALLSGVMIKVGIYLIIRVFCEMFLPVISWQFILCALGSLTIIIGVMMALVQHDVKRLLAYHSVSQIGYMLLGIGTGVAVGVAGGFFHLINHALFKALLFLCIGGVIYRTGTRDLDKLGGLARSMPVTFLTCLIAAFSICGMPPLNGFASKWMIYQGVIELGRNSGDPSWVVWLTAAMLGSALTLASFVKVLHSVFLCKPSANLSGKKIREVGFSMWLPMVSLAGLCVLFGVFAHRLPLAYLIRPAVKDFTFTGTWWAGPATVMLVVGFVLGSLIYFLTIGRKVREAETYIGGEVLAETYISGIAADEAKDVEVTGVDFYRTVQVLRPFGTLYKMAERKYFDLYDIGTTVVFYFVEAFRRAHSGRLPAYLTWVIVGLLGLLYLLMRQS